MAGVEPAGVVVEPPVLDDHERLQQAVEAPRVSSSDRSLDVAELSALTASFRGLGLFPLGDVETSKVRKVVIGRFLDSDQGRVGLLR